MLVVNVNKEVATIRALKFVLYIKPEAKLHLSPQVNLRSIGRKRFAHLSESLDEIHVDANVPWGEDTLFTLEFRADEGGKYALHTCNNKYLSAGGKVSKLEHYLRSRHL